MGSLKNLKDKQVIKEFNQNIKGLKVAIDDLSTPLGIDIGIDNYVMTERQIAKNIMINSSDAPMSEEDAHLVVYGKLMYDNNGKLVDNEITNPECVDKDKAISDDHPILKDGVSDVKNKSLNSHKKIMSLGKDMGEHSKYLTMKTLFTSTEMVTSTIPVVGTVTIPSTLSSIVTLIQNLNILMGFIKDISLYLDDLKYLTYVIQEDALEAVFNPINGSIKTITNIINLINDVKDKLEKFTKFIGGSKDKMKKLKKDAIKNINKDDELTDDEKEMKIIETENQFEDLIKEVENLPWQ
jgi:hypothetical protein